MSKPGRGDRGLGSLRRCCRGGGGHQYIMKQKTNCLLKAKVILNQNLIFWRNFSSGGHRAVERLWECRGKTNKLWLEGSYFSKSQQKIIKISGFGPSYWVPKYEDHGWQLQRGRPKQDVKQDHKESKIGLLSTKISWYLDYLKQVTVKAEVVRGGNEDKETMVRFFEFFFHLSYKLAPMNICLKRHLKVFEFMLISGVDCLQPKGRSRFFNSRFH